MSNLPIKNTDFNVRTIRMDKPADDKYNLWLMHKMGSFGVKIFIVSISFMYLCQKLTRVVMSILYLTPLYMSILYLTPLYMSILDTSIYVNTWHLYICQYYTWHLYICQYLTHAFIAIVDTYLSLFCLLF